MTQRLLMRAGLSSSALTFCLVASAAYAQSQPSPSDTNASGGGTTVQGVPSAETTRTGSAETTRTGSADPTSEAAADGGQLGDIVVTAARQEQNLQKVSAAVIAIDGEGLKKQGLSTVGQVFSNIPSVQPTAQPGGFSIDVRGLGADLPGGSTQGSVALVFDGIYNITSQGTTVGFFDVNRVEVSPGPQSTRYGPNADGGVVQVVTNDPKLGSYSGDASITAGNYKLIRAEAAINIPIGDTLALRVAGAALSRDSYFTPAEGRQAAQSIRAKLLWSPSDALNVKFSYQLDHIGGDGNGSNTFPVFTNKVAVYSGDSINNLSNPWSQSPSNPINDTSADITQQTFAGYATYNFSRAIALDVLGSYTRIRGGGTACIYLPPWSTSQANGPVICGAQTNEFAPFDQYTGELRLHNGPGSRVLWNLGYYHWNYLEQYQLLNAAFLSTPPIRTTTATNAVYGEVTFPVTDRLRLIGGGRYSNDDRTFTFNNSGTRTAIYGIGFHHADYRGGIEYDVAQRSMLYATASSGYRPGGLSAYNPVTHSPNSFGSEVNHAYEIGSKNRFLDNRLQLNVSAFYYKVSNYQLLDSYTGFIPPEGGGVCNNGDTRAGCQTPTFGVGAHSFGVEGQVRASVTKSDLVRFTGTYLDSRFDKNQTRCATVAAPTGSACYYGYNGQSPTDTGAPLFFVLGGAVQPHSPKFAFTAGYEHSFRFASGATLTMGGDAFHTASYWVHPVQDANGYGFQPAYWQGNVQVSFTSADGHESLTGYVRNVSNYAVKQSVLPAETIGDPLTFGVTGGFKF